MNKFRDYETASVLEAYKTFKKGKQMQTVNIGNYNTSLADKAREKVFQQTEKMYELAVAHLSENIMVHALKESYIFDMKEYIDNKMHVDCTNAAFEKVSAWLKSEGFTVEIELEKAMERRLQNPNPSLYSSTKYSGKTFHISW